MKTDHIELIYFSPTTTTKQVLEYIAQGMASTQIDHIDLTPPGENNARQSGEGEITLLGVPVYAGRVPILAVERLQKIKGKGRPAVVVVVYGNRAYEDALIELKEIALDCGFVPVAGGAFIGEHSFATAEQPIANGRPDETDAAEARSFGVKIQDMLAPASSVQDLGSLHVPGNVPYKERPEKKDVAPIADPELCILCGTCAEGCPSGAIDIDEVVQTDPKTCILCHACVKNCPTAAIAFQAPPLQELSQKLSRECQVRQEPEIYLPMG